MRIFFLFMTIYSVTIISVGFYLIHKRRPQRIKTPKIVMIHPDSRPKDKTQLHPGYVRWLRDVYPLEVKQAKKTIKHHALRDRELDG